MQQGTGIRLRFVRFECGHHYPPSGVVALAMCSAMRLFSALCSPLVSLICRPFYPHRVRIFYGFLLRLCALLPIGCIKVADLCRKAFLLPLLSAKI